MATGASLTATVVTARESEVLALLGQHLTNAQIAEALFISPRTVEAHVSALLRKLQLTDRRSLARHADAGGLAVAPAGRSRLPVSVTPMIGRATERAALLAALGEHRLVTAVGPGGVGKTRLATNVATEIAPLRRDGAWFVDLVHVTDPAMVVAAVAEAVEVLEQRAASNETALLASLAGRDGLLVVDNCEHLLDGVRDCIGRIVAGCPSVTVLATSRARLMVPYEHVFAVPGMSVTDEGGDAVDLFVARVAGAAGARAVLDSRRVAALCLALDGSALAIELAAARYSSLGLDGLEAGLEDRLQFLAAGTGRDRHDSLRDAIRWSYDLLTGDDQLLLCAVALFASWFDVDAASAVTASSADRAAVVNRLGRLADHSLLVVEHGEPTCYRALETIRQFGVEQLEQAGSLDAARARHEQWCRGGLAQLATAEPDDHWCVRFDRLADDVRAALLWASADPSRRADAGELASTFAALLFLRGRPREAQQRYEQAAALSPSTAARIDHLRHAAGAATSRHVGDDTLRLLRATAGLAASIGDRASAAHDLAWMSMHIGRTPGILVHVPPVAEATALVHEAMAMSDGSDHAECAVAVAALFGHGLEGEALEPTRHAVELAHRAGDAVAESAALDGLIAVTVTLGDLPGAIRAVRQRADVVGAIPIEATSGFEHSDHQLMSSEVYLAAGDLAAARRHADELARLPFHRDEEHIAVARRLKVDALAGDFDDVLILGEQFRSGWERAGRPVIRNLAPSAYAVAMVHGMLGDEAARADWVGCTHELGLPAGRLAGCENGWASTFDALLALHHDDPEAALRRLDADLDDSQIFGRWYTQLWRPWYAALWAEAAVLADRDDAATRVERSRVAARHNPIATTMVERAAALAVGNGDALDRCARSFEALGCNYQQARTATLAAR